MFMEFATGVEGSTAYLCYFNKKRLIKILHSWGINDFREFLKNYIWYDTDAMMCEFEDRGWSYKKVACEFQSEKEILRRVNKMEILQGKVFRVVDREEIFEPFELSNQEIVSWAEDFNGGNVSEIETVEEAIMYLLQCDFEVTAIR